jgi:mannosyltransferase OCH1-like enzyme
MPDYKIKLWNEENFDYQAYDFSAKGYELGKFAFVSDVCRIHALFSEGGIYLDTDMLVLKGFDDLLEDHFFLGEEKEGLLSAGIIGSSKGNSHLEELLKKYGFLSFDYESPLDIPTFLTSYLDRSKITVYPREYFYPLPFADKGKDYLPFVRKETYAVHLWNHSWKNEWHYLHDKKFSMALTQYVQRCLASPRSIWKDVFWLDFMKYFLADKFGFVYKLYRGK